MKKSGRKAGGGGSCECGISLGLITGVVVDAGGTLLGLYCATSGVELLLVARAIGGYVVFGLIACGRWILISSRDSFVNWLETDVGECLWVPSAVLVGNWLSSSTLLVEGTNKAPDSCCAALSADAASVWSACDGERAV
ncbi:hypothetical protein BC943DRAFT_315423 [Umbelopsis sp. AD052]|nr:hypothetical protein BC943DRAFT_315423 [Umbelopsis sp. AD052]